MAKILLIEDDDHLRQMMEKRLGFQGFDVISATDGEEGLKMATSENPNLIICDVMMPLKDGFQVCRELRSKGVNTPFLFLTGKGLTEDQHQGLLIGADDYIVKPFDPVILEAKVSNYLRRAA